MGGEGRGVGSNVISSLPLPKGYRRGPRVAHWSLARGKRPIRAFLLSQAEQCFKKRAGQDFRAGQASKYAKIASPGPCWGCYTQPNTPNTLRQRSNAQERRWKSSRFWIQTVTKVARNQKLPVFPSRRIFPKEKSRKLQVW